MSKPTRIWWEVVNDGYFGYKDQYPIVYMRGDEEGPYYDEKKPKNLQNWLECTWQEIPETNKIMWLGEDKRAAAEEERQRQEEERRRQEKQERLRREEEERRRREREAADAAEEERRRLAAERERDIPRIRD